MDYFCFKCRLTNVLVPDTVYCCMKITLQGVEKLEKHITVSRTPLTLVNGYKDQNPSISDIAICTKNGINVCVRDKNMSIPHAHCYFYVKIIHRWARPDGMTDYDEIVTDGEVFYVANRCLGERRMKWTQKIQDMVLDSIKEFMK